MRYTLIILILALMSVLIAAPIENIVTHSSGVQVRIDNLRSDPIDQSKLDNDDEGYPTSTLISRTFAMPYSDAQVVIQNMTWNVFDAQGKVMYESVDNNSGDIAVAHHFNFREMNGFTVTIQTQKNIGNNKATLKNVEFSLQCQNPIAIPATVSPAFVEAYQQLADNYNTSYLRNLPLSRPGLLIISHSSLSTYIADFVKWKRQKGFEVYVVNISDIGTSADQIKSFILSHYLQYHSDYLLLMGDTTGNFAIPTNIYPSPDGTEQDADDNAYVNLVGDDYFPEMLVGRMSFADTNEFLIITNKSIVYEKTPYMNDTTWMRRALNVAGNYAEGTLRPSTPVSMSRSLRERMLEYGYAQVDTVFYPFSPAPGTSAIQSSISQGVQFVSYRGWGDANGWHYPSFHIPDLTNTYNGPKMPIVYSIVCNTGDFNNYVNPSFGEKWMRMGTMSNPAGCVAFMGPSDLHTRTRLNNSISTGCFRGIYDFGVRNFGSSVLAGKIELYKNFPNDLAPGSWIPFYFHVYNILSDPTLNLWVLVPNTIPASSIVNGSTFAQSDNHISISNPDLEGAVVTGTKNNIDFTYTTVRNGMAVLPIDPEQTGNLTLTISKNNMVPLVSTLTASNTASLGIVSNSLDGQLVNANQTLNLELTFKNYSATTLTNQSIVLSCEPVGTVTINNAQQTINTIAPNGTQTLSYQLTIGSQVTPREVLTFGIAVAPGDTHHAFQLLSGGAEFEILSTSGVLNLGQNSPISFEIQNKGNVPLNNVSVQILSLTTAMTVTTNNVNMGNFAVGETKTLNTTMQVQASAYNGRNLPIRLNFSDNNNYNISSFYSVTAGTPTNTDPTGPCEYGYFAYDSNDITYPQHPTYQWVEVDPRDGGQGTVYLNNDDGSRVVDLPFTFRFYGVDYNQVTICSNGWMSFGATWMTDFYNHYIPAALGPKSMLAPYWDDLKGLKISDTEFNDMRICYWYDSANNRYIVEWNDAYNQATIEAENPSLEKFQVILYPQQGTDGDIVFQYHTVDNPGMNTNYCTIGIENQTQLIGLTYSHASFYPVTASTLAPNLAIKFTTNAPDTFVSNDDQIGSLPFVMGQNYPNPFNPTTTISFNLLQSSNTSLRVYNLKGQLIRSLMDADVQAGQYQIVWDGKDDQGREVSSGLYLYQLKSGTKTVSRKMLLMK